MRQIYGMYTSRISVNIGQMVMIYDIVLFYVCDAIKNFFLAKFFMT